jgi:hypothetical protein
MNLALVRDWVVGLVVFIAMGSLGVTIIFAMKPAGVRMADFLLVPLLAVLAWALWRSRASRTL